MKGLKFKVWHDRRKEWMSDDEVCMYGDGSLYVLGDGWEDATDRDYYKVVRYTGLKDKNGKEIYEGDIIEGEIWNCLFGYYIKRKLIVKWNEAGYWTTYLNKDYEFIGGYLSDVKNVKVIGNIYQNPELLEEE